MPYKHQAESYRVIAGQRWESWGDFNEQGAAEAKVMLKVLGYKVRRVSIGGEMYRIFRMKTNADS